MKRFFALSFLRNRQIIYGGIKQSEERSCLSYIHSLARGSRYSIRRGSGLFITVRRLAMPVRDEQTCPTLFSDWPKIIHLACRAVIPWRLDDGNNAVVHRRLTADGGEPPWYGGSTCGGVYYGAKK